MANITIGRFRRHVRALAALTALPLLAGCGGGGGGGSVSTSGAAGPTSFAALVDEGARLETRARTLNATPTGSMPTATARYNGVVGLTETGSGSLT